MADEKRIKTLSNRTFGALKKKVREELQKGNYMMPYGPFLTNGTFYQVLVKIDTPGIKEYNPTISNVNDDDRIYGNRVEGRRIIITVTGNDIWDLQVNINARLGNGSQYYLCLVGEPFAINGKYYQVLHESDDQKAYLDNYQIIIADTFEEVENECKNKIKDFSDTFLIDPKEYPIYDCNNGRYYAIIAKCKLF